MIYYVEDDKNIRDLVVYTLGQTEYAAQGFETPKAFWEACKKETPELVLLDIMLPEEDGIEVLKKMRKMPGLEQVPVIMITAKGAEYDKVLGLDLGADDYVVKPFGMMELVSRVRAVLRRSSPRAKEGELVGDGLVVNPKKRTVTAGGEPATLTLKEFELLRFLMENRGIVFSRDKLLETVWGYNYDGGTRTVDVHVQTLRQKLGEYGSAIKTVRGVGYSIGE